MAMVQRKGIITIKKDIVSTQKTTLANLPVNIVQSNNYLYGYTFWVNGLYIFDLNDNYQKEVIDTKIYKIFKAKDGTIYAGTDSGLFIIKGKELVNTNLFKGTVHNIFIDTFNNIWLTSGNKVFKLSNGRVERVYTVNNVKDIYIKDFAVDYLGNIYYSIIGEGFFCYSEGILFDMNEKMGLGSAQTSCVTVDNEGNIWLGTIGKGVFCISNLYLTGYTEQNGFSNNYTRAINGSKSGIILAGTYSGVNIFSGEGFSSIKPFSKVYVYDIKEYDSKFYIACSGMNIGFSPFSSITTNNTNLTLLPVPSIAFIDDDIPLAWGSWANVVFYGNITNDSFQIVNKVNLYETTGIPDRVNKIYSISPDLQFAGCVSGLYKIENRIPSKVLDQTFSESTVYDIKQDRDKKLWIASDDGIGIYDASNWKTMNTIDGNNLSVSRAVEFDNEGRVWIGCLQGLCVYDEKNDSALFLNKENGLFSNNVYCLYYDSLRNFMWVGTNEGVMSINIKGFNSYKEVQAKPYITELEAGGRTYSHSFSEIPYSDNTVTIKFSSIYFHSPDLTYRYKFDTEENEWNVTKNTEIELVSLNPGKYTFMLSAKSINGQWSDPVTLNFVVETPFYRSFVFYSFVTVFTVGISILLVTMRIRKIKNVEQEKRLIQARMNELKQYALTSGLMNPHFIYNALNSIQYLINSNNKKQANTYLTKFSRLLRSNLDSAFESYILLELELKKLETYISLESLRFEKGINYTVNIDSSIDPNGFLLPNMIIQPFLENAIWHGVPEGSKEGYVSISFTKNNGNIIIFIDDRGSGYEIGKNQTKDHVSKGISMIIERLELLGGINNKYKTVQIYSRKDENDKIMGTRVQITLNKNLYREVS
jgi:sensor histidine kinase YesM/ligand-binding sensor domain-containing protein